MSVNPTPAYVSRSRTDDDEHFSIGEMVKEGIKKAREKLIDLTLRNGMLNFKHSETSSRHVRVVNEDPGILVQSLSSGGSVDVVPLPPVESIPRDEDTDQFRAALKEARILDAEWLAAEDARRAAGNRRRNKDKAAERALRDRVRTKLGMPEWRAATDPKVRAQELGINPSYDLPAGNPLAEDPGIPKVQTLFFPDRLEPKLSAIYGAARTLQEDAGIAALYCAVGFLEWYESDDGPNPAYAPLVLVPIGMDKRVVNGEYVFSIAGRDDDATTNVALREKLKQHAIELPEYDAELGIDAFLSRIADSVKSRPRWQVRRWATIGLFSFARQAMWSDLDPECWPADARPEANVLLTQIYGDAPIEDFGAIAPIYDIDSPEVEQKAPVLVTDADASQVSAVIDAAGGKNLVIQGPPGTGKSQTITNIIANAMWQGKSILFISAKMAALNVVKDRLDHIGLGLFCLEVHSAKASKVQLLRAIKERMDAPPILSNAEEIERAQQSLRDKRQRLTEYAAIMNSSVGKTGLTTHDVLWGDSNRSQPPPGMPSSVLDFRFNDPIAIDRFKLAELIGAGKALDNHAAAMGAFAEPGRQLWRGIGNINLTRFDRANAVDSMNEWTAALEQLHQLVNELSKISSWNEMGSIGELERFVRAVREISLPDCAVEKLLLPLALDDRCIHSIELWSDLALEAERLEKDSAAVCDIDKLAIKLELAPQLVIQAEALGVADISIEELIPVHANVERDAREAAQAVALIRRVLTAARAQPTARPDINTEAMAASFLHYARRFPGDKAHFRSTRLTEDGAVEDIKAAQAIADDAITAAKAANFSELATASYASSLPQAYELRDAAATIQNANFLVRLFGRDWRRAKAVWRRAFPDETKLGPTSALRLRAAGQWKEALATLEECVNVKDAVGRHWHGAETKFDSILEIAAWMRGVQKVTPLSISGARELRQILFEANTEEVVIYSEMAEIADSLNILAMCKACYSNQTTLHAKADAQLQRATALEALGREMSQTGLRPGFSIRDLMRASTLYRSAQNCRREMASEFAVLNVIGHVPREAEVSTALKLKNTMHYAKAIIESDLSKPLVKWLLHTEHVERFAFVRKAAELIESAMARELLARRRTEGLLKLNPEVWCGGALEETPIVRLAQKARSAANAPEDLEKQSALLATEEEARRLGLSGLISSWNSNGLKYQDVGWAVEAAFYRSCAEMLMHEHPVLARHTGSTHEQIRKQFQQLDREILTLNRRLVAAKLRARPIPTGRRAQSARDYTDNQMLDHQTGLQKPRIAIRRLFSNAGNAIRAYKPCIMMSPMSVAQYLEPGKHRFDLLIIDEASQMRPEDSLGAMIRCAQAVIVGDPEQLPPSDFFMAADSRADEELEDAPEESILELGRRCWRPMRMLEVHYRSRHQSLIAYSNREFYDERLIVYPSPILTDADFGVTCRFVNGAYEAGQGRNMTEAKAVVEEAAALMRKRIDRSIGIVAVNKAQSDLIETLMDEVAASDPEVQAYRQKWQDTLEAFFVKNLENVQGDERDFILISTVYGRTAEGVFHQHFGPINKAYGHRRLNVLFTRAKRRLALFTSLDYSQIVADGKQRGVRVLKEFLEYAAVGSFQHGRQTGRQPESDFERWFLTRLKAAGYEAHAQVGVAKFRIDIGIIHPDRQGHYIVGLECDGATYHSSKAARDRDRLRQSVLEELNWRIHRVWSTDWYRDPEREFSRLIQSIERAREAPLQIQPEPCN